MMEDKVFGESGARIVVEEFLTGPEVSVLSFTDGKYGYLWFPQWITREHWMVTKGLNTGGMGTVAPNPYYTEPLLQRNVWKRFSYRLWKR